MNIYYNAWSSKYKQPFGAVQAGTTVDFWLDVVHEQVQRVSLSIHKDGHQNHQISMQEIETNRYHTQFTLEEGPGLYFYCFEIIYRENDLVKSLYYGTNEWGGVGSTYECVHDVWDYQLTCFESADPAPNWYRNSIFYQIFPDRFFNGNDQERLASKKPNSFIYGTYDDEPMYIKNASGEVVRWDFYGGNLKGIMQKIPYLKELGINALYLNPIFEARSNHRYDTANYFQIDSMLGTLDDFTLLVEELHKNDMHIILDGVFSHVGRHSQYFNYDGAYGKNNGAAQNPHSIYYDWFDFDHYPDEYKSWWGIKDLPQINKENKHYQQFIYGNKESVIAYWLSQGVDGWRLDVADELPDRFIKGIRACLARYPNKVLIGEVWEDASNKISYDHRRNYILGSHLHSVMNYPLREILLNTLLQESTPKKAAHQLMQLAENYPKDIFYNLFNNLGTHDTERILTKLNRNIRRLDQAIALLIFLPGVPCVYYGDEAGLLGGKDPENRKFFPWQHENQHIYQLWHKWLHFRMQEENLREGEFAVFYDENLLGVIRYRNLQMNLLIVNLTSVNQHVEANRLTFLNTPIEIAQKVRLAVNELTILPQGLIDLTL